MGLIQIFCFLLSLGCITAQVVRKGKCPNVRPQQNIQFDRFNSGVWFKNENFFYDPDFTLRCASFTLDPAPDGSGNIIEHVVGIDVNSGKMISREQVLIPVPSHPGVVALKGLLEVAFIFSRQPKTLPLELRERIYSKLSKTGIDPTKLVLNDHSNCPTMRPIPASDQ